MSETKVHITNLLLKVVSYLSTELNINRKTVLSFLQWQKVILVLDEEFINEQTIFEISISDI